jgi:hypothetical protein
MRTSAGARLGRPTQAVFTLPDERAAVLTDEDSPAVVAGVFPVLRSLYATEDGRISARRPAEGWAGTSTAIGGTAAPPG